MKIRSEDSGKSFNTLTPTEMVRSCTISELVIFTKFKILISAYFVIFLSPSLSFYCFSSLILGAIDLDEIKNKLNEIDIRISDEDARKLLKK